MIVPHQAVDAAKQCGERFPQFVPSLGRSIATSDVVELMVTSTSPAAQRGARELLRRMGNGAWRVVAAVHASDRDSTPHITVEVARVRYHLRLDARHCIFDITSHDGTSLQRLSGHLPWVAPGAG